MNQFKPLVTIAIPIYNVAEYVVNCIQSVLKQDYNNIEILVFYDISSDDSLLLARQTLCNANRPFRIIEKKIEDKGLGFSRNMALNEANGELLYFLDSDDYITYDAISLLVDEYKESNAEIICGSFERFDITTKKSDVQILPRLRFGDNKFFLEYIYLHKGKYPIYAWNKLYDISFLKKYAIHCVHTVVEDDIFSFDIIHKVSKISLLDNITYTYVIRPNSTTNVVMSENVKIDIANIYVEIKNYEITEILKSNDTYLRLVEFMKIMHTAVIMTVRNSLSSKYINSKDKKELCKRVFCMDGFKSNHVKNLPIRDRLFYNALVVIQCVPNSLLYIISQIVRSLFSLRKIIK